MRRLAPMLALLLAACVSPRLVAVSAEDWQPDAPDMQAMAREFTDVSRKVSNAARTECNRRTTAVNCDFVVLVDLDPRAPANAFQTLDDKGRPVIIFTQSMIRSTLNADEVAFVMGHEAAHHVLNHIARQAQNAKDGARSFGDRARALGEDAAAIEAAQELGAEVGVQSYAREFELEADQLGTIITYRSGYNPLIGAKYFARIPDPGDQFFATHPPNAQRVQMVLQTAAGLGVTQ
ncbi:M48 family metalloprotease [Ruegeria sp.]|uniref:M48 family metalloprotease n=1 Tax=Ruegeria sp. TaxID=1879320 RepID=UPI0023118E84|nr:M48 family metalloprotease [Ruegeria sp.]MDA7966083.1 M48 family metalloprotease [Ruegeria sp.]